MKRSEIQLHYPIEEAGPMHRYRNVILMCLMLSAPLDASTRCNATSAVSLSTAEIVEAAREGNGVSSFRSLLRKMPVATQHGLLRSMVFSGGHLVSIRADGVNRYLTDAEQRILITDLVGSQPVLHGKAWRNKTGCTPYKEAYCFPFADARTPVELSTILAGLPKKEVAVFLDSIDFVSGKLVAIDTTPLEAYLTPRTRQTLKENVKVNLSRPTK